MLDGRIMGLDIGDKTIGVAVSDIMGITAQGVKTIRRESKKKDIEELKNIIKERQVLFCRMKLLFYMEMV